MQHAAEGLPGADASLLLLQVGAKEEESVMSRMKGMDMSKMTSKFFNS